MYKIVYTKEASRKLVKAPRNLSLLIRAKLDEIAQDPIADHQNVRKLQNRPGYRLRVDDWRVIYELQNEVLVILVVKIAPRGEVYR